jgi:hypothetical protein
VLDWEPSTNSTNMFEGIGFGLWRAGQGMWDGVTGIVTDPMDGARDGGVVGRCAGVLGACQWSKKPKSGNKQSGRRFHSASVATAHSLWWIT